jgi:acyl-CoA synthetase (AMP-forming)/AMP-acid ligase II
VIGIPHGGLGEEVAAAVALEDGARTSVGELRDSRQGARSRLQDPRVVWLVDSSPRA